VTSEMITPVGVSQESVLADIAGMLRVVLDDYGMEDAEITLDTKFHDDLELESIDLVTLSSQLEDRYGDRVNFAEFVAGLDVDEIIDLSVGRLVDYVVTALRQVAA
jgi:acyl carrier protein